MTNFKKYAIIAFIIFIFLNIGDTIITYLLIGNDYSLENNPIMQVILYKFGYAGMIVAKIIGIVVTGSLINIRPNTMFWILVAANILYAFVVVNTTLFILY